MFGGMVPENQRPDSENEEIIYYPAPEPVKECWYGHRSYVVGCVSCVLVHGGEREGV